jgi:acetyl esterase
MHVRGGSPPGADRSDPRVTPLRTTRFDAVPPTTVVTCGLDPLRTEGRTPVRSLAAADVPVTRVDFPRCPHGVFTFLPRLGLRRTVATLREVLAATPTGGE